MVRGWPSTAMGHTWGLTYPQIFQFTDLPWSNLLCVPGFNPRWNCTFNFTVHVPDLALVRFMVEDHDFTSSNDFLGQYTLPFTSMRSGARHMNVACWDCGFIEVVVDWSFVLTGYRHVPLFKMDGSCLSPSALFIHVKLSPCYSGPSKSMAPSPRRSPAKCQTKRP